MPQRSDIGVCSWAVDRDDPVRAIRLAGTELGLRAVQVGFFGEDAVHRADPKVMVRTADSVGVTLISSFVAFDGEDYSSIARIAETGGFTPDREYPQRLAMTRHVAELSATLGCGAIAVHVGTIPADPTVSLYAKLTARVREVADALREHDLRLHIETGRESAEVLRDFIQVVDRENVAANFDCANFVVYGTDEPTHAIRRLAERIEGVHLKDARRSRQPGIEYGQAAPLGTGDVDVPGVVNGLHQVGYTGSLLIECSSREAGLDSVRAALGQLQSTIAGLSPD